MALDKVLIVDDDKNICDLLRLYLEKEGYSVILSHDGEEAVVKFNALKPDIVLLDVMLPGLDGWQVCREIRKKSNIPILMITAKSDTFDKVLGLELGADDYIVKPFDAKELLARIKAVLRRSSLPENEKCVTFEDLEISLDNYSVTLDGKQIEMPPKEIELLFFLASREGKVFTREQLLEQVWGFDFFGDSRTVDVHVKRIREKLGERDAWQLKTVWGVGYKFEAKK